MRENRIQAVWAKGGVPRNVFLAIPNAFSAEVMASVGFDGITVDMQHGLSDYRDALAMMQAMSRYDVTPMVRVPWNDPAIVMKSLDAGAMGVICPMINTRAEAEKFVGACRYAPKGYRSTGPVRAVFYAGTDYHNRADTAVLTFAMIETQQALDNLDDILTVPGLDAVYIGPSDLSVSLGGSPGGDQREPRVMEAIELILARAKAQNVKACIHTLSPDYANEMIAKGFDLVTISSDHRMMQARAAEMLGAIKGGA